jgi:peptidoglycan hydrolase CwlO-like protein
MPSDKQILSKLLDHENALSELGMKIDDAKAKLHDLKVEYEREVIAMRNTIRESNQLELLEQD